MLRRSRTALALGLLLGLTGCTAPGDPPGAGVAPGVVVEERGPAGAVPEALARYYAQPLTWEGCASYATTETDQVAYADPQLECARLEVPLDYSRPESRIATIGLLRRPATDPAARIGALVVNPGGPGASGMSAAASLAWAVAGTEIGRRFDLVGFDPRGVGASEPKIRCLTTEERDAERLDSDTDTSPTGVAQTEAEERAFAQTCAERVGIEVLANVGSRDVARDMDILRSALGERRLNYLGYSYGTRVAIAYAEQFGGNVRTMILDGAVDPDQELVESLVAQGAGFQQAFDAFNIWCVQQPSCWLEGDAAQAPEEAPARFRALTLPLDTRPLPVGQRALSYSDATTATIQALYANQLWPVLNEGLQQLAADDGTILLQLADLYYERSPRGYSTAQDAFTAIRCMDYPPVTDPAVLAEADRRYREAAPFLDDGQPPSAAADACAFWPVPPTSRPHRPRVPGLPRTLVVSTTGDPATPHAAGAELARALGAVLLTFEGNQHTVVLQGVPCVDEIVTHYLVDLRLPPAGARCAAGP